MSGSNVHVVRDVFSAMVACFIQTCCACVRYTVQILLMYGATMNTVQCLCCYSCLYSNILSNVLQDRKYFRLKVSNAVSVSSAVGMCSCTSVLCVGSKPREWTLE
jgi:hypothetical protein